jgi:CubicO group peptidase (beta-lactamase class C family)
MRRRQFVSLLGGAALAPLTTLPVYADPTDGCGVPVAREDGWPVASVNDDKLVDRDALCRMADRLVASNTNVHAVLVARGGKLVFERYFKGSDEINGRRVESVTFDADTLHNIKSATKGVASLALGIAIDRGLIAASMNRSLASSLSCPTCVPLKRSAFSWCTRSRCRWVWSGWRRFRATRATTTSSACIRRPIRRYVLGLPVTAPAGRDFFYNTGALTLVSAIVRKATGRPLDEFARETLFEPLGITSVEWVRVKGDSDAGGGLRMRPRDMAKIGQLVLARGRWNDRQVVSKAWIDASMTPRLEATTRSGSFFYGYLWWLGRSLFNGREIHWDGALGRGGQSIRIVPELDLVVVVTAGYYRDYSPHAFQLQSGVFKDVLRAVPPAD